MPLDFRTGSGADYVRPFGQLPGLVRRLATWSAKLRAPIPNMPCPVGLIDDIEVVMRLLNAREFAEWLHQHGEGDASRFAADFLAALDEQEGEERLATDIERALPVANGQTYADAVDQAASKAIAYDAVRATLVNCGAMADDDDTDVPALIRALLS